MYIVGIIANKETATEVLERSGNVYKDSPTIQTILDNMVDKHGGVDADYSVYDIDDTSNDADRIFKQQAVYDLEWTGDVVTGIDFTTYDSWNQMDVSASKSTILANGTDTSVITFTMYESDGTTVDTSFSSPIDICIIEYTDIGKEENLTELDFTAGVATINFTSTNDGSTWAFPKKENTDIENNLKIKNKVSIEVSN
jgi:hypothetical protein